MSAFLAQYPTGFYASLAKLQLEKFATEEARVAATEKARLAEQERARLATEGAQKAAQVKAEADAKSAEQARIAAEKAKQVAQDQAAAAEQKRAEAEKAAADKAAAAKEAADSKVAAVTPAPAKETPNLAAQSSGASQAEVTKSVQAELRRVGCLSAAADGNWNTTSQRSLTLFNRYAKTSVDTKLASTDALDTIKSKSSRVCPLVCEHGYKVDGDSCVKISCAEGSFLNDDNQCEKRREKKPVAKRDSYERDDRAARPVRERPQSLPEAIAPKPRVSAGGSGQIVCDQGGCRPVRRGCSIDYRGGSPRDGGGNVEVCN
jgi:hypothetical protein